jgi:hypothetical protein
VSEKPAKAKSEEEEEQGMSRLMRAKRRAQQNIRDAEKGEGEQR